jgi:glutathione S-transferase
MYRLNAAGTLWQDDDPNRISLKMLKLVIGNKNYSSWSMRPWLALRANGIPFEEVFIPLYTDNKADKERILSFSDAGKVPTLVDGDITVWDSLAIIEYLAEKFPHTRLWPEDRAARAHARSISAEMHSGFMALRNECGMNLHRPIRGVALSDDARANVARIQAIWTECYQRYRKGGPFLFGAFSGADAMFAPVVHRFRTYAIPVGGDARHYSDAMMALPAFQEWTRDGLAETLRIDRMEAL